MSCDDKDEEGSFVDFVVDFVVDKVFGVVVRDELKLDEGSFCR